MTAHPMLRYEDATAAIEWLARAFGFEKGVVAATPDGAIAHAEMRAGDTVLFVATLTPDRRRHFKTPKEAGGGTQGIYVSVDDVDAHHARAQAAGAQIVQAPADAPQGRGYVALDLEGHLWGFGTYVPGSRQSDL